MFENTCIYYFYIKLFRRGKNNYSEWFAYHVEPSLEIIFYDKYFFINNNLGKIDI